LASNSVGDLDFQNFSLLPVSQSIIIADKSWKQDVEGRILFGAVIVQRSEIYFARYDLHPTQHDTRVLDREVTFVIVVVRCAELYKSIEVSALRLCWVTKLE